MHDVYINGLGRFLPGPAVSNAEMESYLGLIGGMPSRYRALVLRQNKIKTRHYALDTNGKTLYSNAGMAAEAIRDAIGKSELSLGDIGYLATSTTLGDVLLPGLDCHVHAALGIPPIEIASFSSVCASALMAVKSAWLQLKSGEHACAAISGSEFASRYFYIVLLDKPVALLMPATVGAVFIQMTQSGGSYHPLMGYGALALPLAFAVHYTWLKVRGEQAQTWQHMLSYLALTVLAGIELGYWLDKAHPLLDAQIACGSMLAVSVSLLLLASTVTHRYWPLSFLSARAFTEAALSLGAWLVLNALYSLTLPVAAAGESYIPLLNLIEIGECAALAALVMLPRSPALADEPRAFLRIVCGAFAFFFVNAVLLRMASHTLDVPYLSDAMFAAPNVQTLLTILWTLIAMGAMVVSSRVRMRAIWSAGAILLAVVVVKLFFVDLANTGSLARIVSFLGVGFLTVVLGYLAPMPPKVAEA